MRNALKKTSVSSSAAVLLLALSVSRPVQAQTAYAINNFGTTLIRFDLSSPGTFTTIGNFSGTASTLRGLDFRPANGLLYGYDAFSNPNGIYTIDLATAVTSFVSAPENFLQATMGLDFNPTVDRLRLVSTGDQNRRVNVDNGATILDNSLAYNAVDANAGIDPDIAEVAYTNNDNSAATSTTIYYLDHTLDILATSVAPNVGILDTVGGLGVNTDSFNGFDILTQANGVNSAFALLRVGGAAGLYSINLNSGAATPVGVLAGDNPVVDAFSLAIAPIPEPSSLVLLIVAVACQLWRRRMR